jgi:hypothetical protein
MIKITVNLNLEKDFKKAVDRQAKVKLLNAVVALKNATPVDTGNARDNWKIESNKIINEVEYIEHLNAGSSLQAPAYFVEKTLLAQQGIRPSGTIVRSL